jgi:hypothetical protein
MDEIKSLEEQLRSLPREAVPQKLLGKLLAGIPATADLRRQRRSHKFTLPFLAVAAVLVVATSISIFHRGAAQSEEHSISAHYVIYRPTLKQETDPCNVFPPLPESHRF